MRKLVSVLLFAAVAGSLLGCDSKPTEVTKTVHDTLTVYTDRFAGSKVVVYGEWSVVSTTTTGSTDTAQAVFFQDSNQVTAFIPWKGTGITWNLSGPITADSISLTPSQTTTISFYGAFRKLEPTTPKPGGNTPSRIADSMGGEFMDVPHRVMGSWVAKRKV